MLGFNGLKVKQKFKTIFVTFRYGAGQLKVMCVGGPNVRKDYHIDEGEEVS